MSDAELLDAFKRWKKRAGAPKASAELSLREICPRTTEKLVKDKYTQRPNTKLRTALLEIVKAS